MIDRYVIEYNLNLISKIINSEKVDSFDSQYNAAPTKLMPIVSIKSPNKVDLVHWGASSDYANKVLFDLSELIKFNNYDI